MVWFGKKTKLSFGIDWSENAVKIVGLRMIGSRFELTHCLLFDVPEELSPEDAAALVRKRLKRINFFRGTVTMNLPSEGFNVPDPENTPRFSSRINRLRNYLSKNDECAAPLYVELPGEDLYNQWNLRNSLVDAKARFELPDFSLPLIEKDINDEDVILFVYVGFDVSRVSIVKGSELKGQRRISFTVREFLPPDLLKKKEAHNLFRFLKTVHIKKVNNRWQWHSSQSIEGMSKIFRAIERQIEHLGGIISQQIEDFQQSLNLTVNRVRLVGPGALYPWLSIALGDVLKRETRPADPFSRLDLGNEGRKSQTLKKVAPIFAQAAGMAISGGMAKKSPSPDLTPGLRSFAQKKTAFKGRIRLFSLSLVLLSLVLYLSLSFQVNSLIRNTERLRLEMQDMKIQLQGYENRQRFSARIKSVSKYFHSIESGPSLSKIFEHLDEWLPNGCWLNEVQYIPASKVSYFKEKKSTANAIVFRGEAISGNFVIDFFENLKRSGFFSVAAVLKQESSPNQFENSVRYEITAKPR